MDYFFKILTFFSNPWGDNGHISVLNSRQNRRESEPKLSIVFKFVISFVLILVVTGVMGWTSYQAALNLAFGPETYDNSLQSLNFARLAQTNFLKLKQTTAGASLEDLADEIVDLEDNLEIAQERTTSPEVQEAEQLRSAIEAWAKSPSDEARDEVYLLFEDFTELSRQMVLPSIWQLKIKKPLKLRKS